MCYVLCCEIMNRVSLDIGNDTSHLSHKNSGSVDIHQSDDIVGGVDVSICGQCKETIAKLVLMRLLPQESGVLSLAAECAQKWLGSRFTVSCTPPYSSCTPHTQGLTHHASERRIIICASLRPQLRSQLNESPF